MWGGISGVVWAYWVDFEVPRLSGCVQVNGDFFVVEPGFLEGDVGAVCPGADAAGV